MLDKKRVSELFSKENLFIFMLVYMVFFINTIHLFAEKTDYFGRISFIFIVLLGTILFFKELLQRYNENKNSILNKFILLNIIFFLYVMINGILNKDIKRLIYGGYQYILYGMIFYAVYIYIKEINLKKIIDYVIIFNVINSLICIYEYVSRSNLIPTEYGQIAYDGIVIFRGRAFFGSFLNAGVVLGMTVFLALYFLLKSIKEKNNKQIFGYSSAILIYILGIFSTGSRGPLVSLFGGLIFAFIIYSILLSKKRKQNFIILGVIAILGIISLLIILNIDATKLDSSALSFAIHRVQTIFDWSTDPGNVMRIERWNFGLDLFKQNPVFGVGIATTGAKGLGTFSLGVTESGVIKKLAELGIVGSLLFYFQFIFIGVLAFKKIISKETIFEKKIFILLIVSAIVMLLIEECIYQALEAEVVAFYLWMFVAFIFKVCDESKKNSELGGV